MSRINNSVNLIGRIASDIDTKTVGESHLASFTIAVDRPKSKKGDVITDFVRCNAWGFTAEFIAKYFGKGRKIAIQGELNIDSREMDDGSKRSYTSVRVDSVDFADSKSTNDKGNEFAAPAPKKTAAKRKTAIDAVEDDADKPW
jgi:single-strand DNA-binding protein